MPTGTEVSFRAPPLARLVRLVRARGLVRALLLKDLRVQYRNSLLGFLWALLQPLVLMLVYTAIFVFVARVAMDSRRYAALVLTGLVPWTFVSSALAAGTGSIRDNASLVKKVRFPREVLPLSVVGAGAVQFALSLIVLLGLLLALGVAPTRLWLLLPGAVALLLILTSGLVLAAAALDPVFRDMRHLVPTLTLLWFFATPIAYPFELVPAGARPWLRLNPMTGIVELFQGILVRAELPTLWQIAYPALAAALSLWVGLRLFGRFDGRLADLV